MTLPLADVLVDLQAYRDAVAKVDPMISWAHAAQHSLPGVIFWTVDKHDRVTMSVGAGLAGSGLDPHEIERSLLSNWTSNNSEIVHNARQNGEALSVIDETEGPCAGHSFLTSAVLRANGDVVCMTVDLSEATGMNSPCRPCEQ